MKLKTKLLLTIITVVVLPVILIYICIQAMGIFQGRTLQQNYAISGVGDVYSGASVQIFNTLTSAVVQEIETVAKSDPDKLLDKQYQDSLNDQLSGKYSHLVIMKDGVMVFNGSRALSDEEVMKLLPEEEIADDDSLFASVYIKDADRLIQEMTIRFEDGSKGEIFIVTTVSTLIPQMKNMLGSVLLLILVLLILIAAALVTWIYKDILSPLNELKRATYEIKEGNLDYELKIHEKNEIGQLCMDFEEMRQRLKDNAEEKIENDRENKELISNISHDLKTPITSIKGYALGIMEGVASSPEKLDRYIRTIYNKANDMDRLIDELTFYSKIDTNKIPYSFAKININDYFSDCVEELSMDLESQNIDLAFFDYTDEPVTIIADVEQLKRVINNIISNSVKYLDKKKGVINIRLKDEGDFVHIEIEDNGKGIAARDLPNIFDRFYRTDSSRNSSKGGSGIGLSIVKKIVEDHGGRIWATSKESIGTVMHIVLRKYTEVVYE